MRANAVPAALPWALPVGPDSIPTVVNPTTDLLAQPGLDPLMLTDPFLLLFLACLGLGFAIVAIRAPLQVHANNWHSAEPHYEPSENKPIARDVLRLVADLASLGFQGRGHWRYFGHSIATGRISLMEHPHTLDLAKVLDTRARQRRQLSLLFETRFADGTTVTTANNQRTVGLPASPEATVVWLPQVRDARSLYAVHQQIRESMMFGKKPIPIGADPSAFLTAGSKENLRHFANAGYFYLDEAHQVYRPTWKGAFLMTWRLLPPIRPFYFAWRRRRTRKLLRHLGIGLPVNSEWGEGTGQEPFPGKEF